jgi:hypothetical protein
MQDAEQLATRIWHVGSQRTFHNRQEKIDRRAAARLTAEGQQWEVRPGWKETLPSYRQIMAQGIFNPDPFDGAAIRNVASLPDNITRGKRGIENTDWQLCEDIIRVGAVAYYQMSSHCTNLV